MSVILYKQFFGEIPNTDPHLLPPDRAQKAVNCEFNSGSLKPMKGGFLLQVLSSNPIKGLYTEDGSSFYSWPTQTFAFKGPVIDDSFRRVYFLQPGGDLKVTNNLQMAYNGPTPTASNTWNAGVPRPSVSPTLTTVDRTTLRDYPSAYVTIEAWWEYAGSPYGKTSFGAASDKPFRSYTFAAPAKPSGTPEGAVLAARLVIKDGATGADIVSVSTKDGGSSGRSTSLPGGLELSMTTSGLLNTMCTLTISWGIVETRAYTYTYTNTWNEEGAPSPASTISVTYMQDVRVVVSAASFTGYRPFSGYRVYRTYGTGTTYIQVDVSGAAPNLLDSSTSSRAMGTALESANWTPPPSGLRGIVLMPNGWFAAFKGNTLYMSEPYRPHAWPYSQTFAKDIRGIAVAQQSLVVTTSDGVSVVTGAFPASAQAVRLNSPQPGINQASMAVVDGAVVYASNDGLVFVNGAEASLSMSQKLFTRSKWREAFGQALQDGSLALSYHDGCLVGTSKTMGKGFSIRFDEDVGSYSRISEGYDAMFLLPVSDTLYYAVGNAVYQFKGGSDSSYEFWGKEFVFPAPSTMGAGYIRAEGLTTITLYADGEQVYTGTVNPGYFRLPSMPRARRWSLKLVGSSEVHEVAIAQTMSELKVV